MDIRFECEKCGQLLVIEEAGAGINIPCPSCSTILTVPVVEKTADKPAGSFFSQTRELKNSVVKAAVRLLFPPGANIPEACFDVWNNRDRARGEILTELRKIGSVPKETVFKDILNNITSLDSILKTIQDVACGVDHFMAQNYDALQR
jgi:phage FluMu protein Com